MAKEFVCTTDGELVRTRAGILRGYKYDGVYRFYGVEYATAERFMQPVPVEPWEGIKDARVFGNTCPRLDNFTNRNDFFIPHRNWAEGEDCLNMNIWTPSIHDGKKRAVMVWLHGGRFDFGSAVDMLAYDGDEMARRGDIVVITVNHRINIYGYCDLSSFGPEYANSGNCGQADLVAALQWIHDNIEAFGGDPDNVTLFGQSAGGTKIMSLIQTPAADGLFAKGILMSGGADPKHEPQVRHDRELAQRMIRWLGGKDDNDIDVLRKASPAKMREAYEALSQEFLDTGIAMIWEPCPNDWYLGDVWHAGYTEHGKTIPLMVGNVMAENGFAKVENMDRYTTEERRAMIAERLGEDTDQMIDLFRKAFPDKNELILYTMSSRKRIFEFADKRVEENCADTYLYLFTYCFKVNGGSAAWHCSDIPFAFHNCDMVPFANEPGVTEALEEAYFGAYVSFAKYGRPDAGELARWNSYHKDRSTMFFDAHSEAKQDLDTDLHTILAKYDKPRFTPSIFINR